MSENEPVEPHEQDDCDDCRKQRAQNNQLIEFYQRLNKLKTKVTEIKPEVTNHFSASKQERGKLEKMSVKMTLPPNLIAEVNNLDSKEMGYQLTCALLERELKMKKENQKLSRRIRQLKAISKNNPQSIKIKPVNKKDSEMQSQPQTDIFGGGSRLYMNNQSQIRSKMKQSNSIFSDSLDSALSDNSKSFWGTHQVTPLKTQRPKEQNSRYSQSFGYNENNKDPSTFSSFQQTGRSIFNQNEQLPKKKYQNLNLWLYQINTQQQQNKQTKTKSKNTLTKKK